MKSALDSPEMVDLDGGHGDREHLPVDSSTPREQTAVGDEMEGQTVCGCGTHFWANVGAKNLQPW